MDNDIDLLLQEIESLRNADLPANIRASKIFSVKCRLRKLGWADDQPADSQQATWKCPHCGTTVVTYVPVLEAVCSKHSPRPRMIIQ